MTLEEKLTEIEHNTESYRGYAAITIDCLIDALKVASKQRDSYAWAYYTETDGFLDDEREHMFASDTLKDNEEILEILNGKH